MVYFSYDKTVIKLSSIPGRVPQNLPAAFKSDGPQLFIGINCHGMLGVFQQRHILRGVTISKIEALHLQMIQHLFDLALLCG